MVKMTINQSSPELPFNIPPTQVIENEKYLVGKPAQTLLIVKLFLRFGVSLWVLLMSLRIHSPNFLAVPPLGWKMCYLLLMCNGMQTANAVWLKIEVARRRIAVRSDHRCIILYVPKQNYI